MKSAMPDREEGRIQSVERAFQVLEMVAQQRDGIGLSELSRALDLHTSTLYHLTRTLVALGFLRTGPGDKRYRMGRGIYQIAAACLDEAELSAIVQPYLGRLAAATGEATHFAIWERRKALILTRCEGPNALQITERAGILRPIYCTAIGKVLLTGLTDEVYEEYVAEIDFEPLTQNTLRDPQALRQQVERARREGIAYDDCEFNPEVRCMAAPVRDFRGQVLGAIGFSGPVWRLSLAGMSDFISVTRSIASEVSDHLGFRPGEVAQEKNNRSRRANG